MTSNGTTNNIHTLSAEVERLLGTLWRSKKELVKVKSTNARLLGDIEGLLTEKRTKHFTDEEVRIMTIEHDNEELSEKAELMSAEVERLRAENAELSNRLVESGRLGLAEMAKSAELMRENAELRKLLLTTFNELKTVRMKAHEAGRPNVGLIESVRRALAAED